MSSTRPRILIHMGESKTGTTTLQSILFKAREALAEQDVIYADSGRVTKKAIGHHMLLPPLYDSESHRDLADQPHWKDLKSEIESYGPDKRILISSEGFSSLKDPIHAQMLKDFFEGYDVSFYLAARRPDQWTESIYAQFVKNRPFTCAPFRKFVRNFGLRASVSGTLIGDTFGDDAITLLPYGSDIVPRFIKALEIKDLEIPESARSENKTPSALINAAYYALNHVSMPMNERGRLYREIADYCETHGDGQAKTKGKPQRTLPQFKFTDTERQDFLDLHRADFRVFCDRFGLSFDDIYGDYA